MSPPRLSEKWQNLLDLIWQPNSYKVKEPNLQQEGEVAPIGSWITRYQARGHTKRYWYYKWLAIEPVFPTRTGKLSRYKHLGKAGSPAYLEAVSQLVRRDKIEGKGQAIKTLKAGLADLSEEGMKNRTKWGASSRNFLRELTHIYSWLREWWVGYEWSLSGGA